ncbi:hypothetical protein ACQEVY_41175 [Streptomyces sp. CA-288835]
MESMGKKKPRPRRSFTPEFKAEIDPGERSLLTRAAVTPFEQFTS